MPSGINPDWSVLIAFSRQKGVSDQDRWPIFSSIAAAHCMRGYSQGEHTQRWSSVVIWAKWNQWIPAVHQGYVGLSAQSHRLYAPYIHNALARPAVRPTPRRAGPAIIVVQQLPCHWDCLTPGCHYYYLCLFLFDVAQVKIDLLSVKQKKMEYFLIIER